MPDQIPPPGPERDAEIARALGWTRVNDRDTCSTWITGDGRLRVAWSPSTDPAACDRLEAELDGRGYEVQASRIAGYCNVFARRGVDGEPVAAIASSRPDAVSAAALLALRDAS